MIELLAAASDGWALVRSDDERWLVRPPYRQRDRDPLTELEVERALVNEDFVPVGRSFEGWGTLCRHLQERTVGSATADQLEDARGAAARLLARATAEQARDHLIRVREAIDAARPSGVETALIALLQAEAVTSDPMLVAEVGELLARAHRARFELHTPDSPQRAWPVSDEAQVKQQSEAIRDRRSLFAPAA